MLPGLDVRIEYTEIKDKLVLTSMIYSGIQQICFVEINQLGKIIHKKYVLCILVYRDTPVCVYLYVSNQIDMRSIIGMLCIN